MAINGLPQELIRHKRDGGPLNHEQIAWLVHSLVDGTISDSQIAAWAMAVYFQGLDLAERVALTEAMAASGTRLTWTEPALPGPVLDKHSTGGVGDKVSLLLAPLVAACGGYVPMLSGRGLGHTGGTQDKLAAIPGYDTAPTLDRLRQVVRDVGCAIIGQTAELAPADRRLYAIRDVTATVESIGLITASILSKKLAEGLEGLVLDVKTGSGAFLADLPAARELAESLVTVAQGAGLATTALITDMNQVLGRTAGNALEVAEATAFLRGEPRDSRLAEVTLALSAELLQLGRLAANAEQARRKLVAALDSGQAAERFAQMVAALGGPTDWLERAVAYLPKAPVIEPIFAERPGYVSAMDTRAIGWLIVQLGGGRRQVSDLIDYAVGLSDVCQIGEWVDEQQPLARVHARDTTQVTMATMALRTAITLSATVPAARLLVHGRFGGG